MVVNREQLLGLIRHIITFGGGIMVARGKLDVGSVDTIAGAVVSLAGVILSYLSPEKLASGGTPIMDTKKPG